MRNWLPYSAACAVVAIAAFFWALGGLIISLVLVSVLFGWIDKF
jgi:hypothetical protein